MNPRVSAVLPVSTATAQVCEISKLISRGGRPQKSRYRSPLVLKQRELRVGTLALRSAHIVEDRPTAQGSRDITLMGDGSSEVRKRLALFLYCAGQAVQATEAFHLFGVSELRSIQSPPQHS